MGRSAAETPSHPLLTPRSPRRLPREEPHATVLLGAGGLHHPSSLLRSGVRRDPRPSPSCSFWAWTPHGAPRDGAPPTRGSAGGTRPRPHPALRGHVAQHTPSPHPLFPGGRDTVPGRTHRRLRAAPTASPRCGAAPGTLRYTTGQPRPALTHRQRTAT